MDLLGTAELWVAIGDTFEAWVRAMLLAASIGVPLGLAIVDDLADKTFAVAGLHGIEEVAVRTILDVNGVDASGITFTEVPFPDMNAAVAAGEVDVASQVEPFVTLVSRTVW